MYQALIRFIPLFVLSLIIQDGESFNDEQYFFIGLSTHYQAYHDAFEQDKVIKTSSRIECVGNIVRMRTGSQEDWRIAFRYNNNTQDCQMGKVPFQLVRIVTNLEKRQGFNKFVDNGSPEKLLIWGNGIQEFTKVAVIGSHHITLNEVIDLSSPNTTCAPLPSSPFVPFRTPGIVLHNDQPVACSSMDASYTPRRYCHGLKADLSGWDQLSQLMTSGRAWVNVIHQDFNEFLLVGGYQSPGQVMLTTTETFKVQIDPSREAANPSLPTQLRHLTSGVCHVQLDMELQFFAGGETPSASPADVAGLWNINTLVWTDLPKLATARSALTCGYFRNKNGVIEVVAAGGAWLNILVNEVEIYNPTTLTKRTGPPLTMNTWSNGIAQFTNHFITIGGWEGLKHVGEIRKFDPITETFVLLPQSVTARDQGGVVAIPDSMTTCT